jgi:hypothetical protein
MLESTYQTKLIKKIKYLFPGCIVLKNDSSYQQGIPDWLILYGRAWATLEIKREYARPGSDDFEPNQEWFIDQHNEMSFSACVYPENEREILDALITHMETYQ